MKKRFIPIILLLFALFFALQFAKDVNAVGPQLSIIFNNTPTINIGNNSQIYNLTIIVNNTGNGGNATYPINVTLLLPKGITNNTATDCDLSFTFTNRTTNTCVFNVSVGNSGLDAGIAANITLYKSFLASHVAYIKYTSLTWIAQGRCMNCSSGNVVNTTSTMSVNANPFWINPRPYLFSGFNSTNSTFTFDEWGQIRPYYEIWAPLMTYNSTAGRPTAANNSYADVIYADRPFFNNPAYMEMWGYKLNFTIYLNDTGGETNWTNESYNIYTPFLNVGNQTLYPLMSMSVPISRQGGNTTTTMAVPAAAGFTVWYNGSQYTDTSLYANYSLNVSYNSAYGRANDMRLLTVTVPTNLRGNVSISVMFTLMANGTGGSSTSPVYVTNQIITGFNPTDASATPNGNINTSYIIQLINPLPNFTLTDLRLKFLVPINVTLNHTITNVTSVYTITPTNGTNVTWSTNSSIGPDWEGGADFFITTTSANITDSLPGSATSNYNISVLFRFFEINLTYSNFSNWNPTSQNFGGISFASLSNITANMTARMFFPILNKTFDNSSVCSGGSTYAYNLTFNMAQRGRFNLTSELGSCFDANKQNIDIRLDNVALTSTQNRTIGSLELNDVPSGTHSVTVSYKVSSTTSSSSGGGTTSSTTDSGEATTPATTQQVITKTFIADLVPGIDSVFNVDDTTAVSRLLVSSTGTIYAASFTYTKLNELPSSIVQPSGNVYGYFSIVKENIKDTDLKYIKVEFKVPKSFLTGNNLKPEQVKLMRLTTQWNVLETTILSDDVNEVTYQSTSPGTSYFAISTAESQETAPETTGEAIEEPRLRRAPSSKAVWIAIVILILVAIFIYLIMLKKKKK